MRFLHIAKQLPSNSDIFLSPPKLMEQSGNGILGSDAPL